MKCGYLYYSGGKTSYLQEAARSALSVRKIDRNADICLLHRHSPDELALCDTSMFDRVNLVRIEEDLPPRFDGQMIHFLAKIQALIQSPYEVTLFLDSDTRVWAPVGELFLLMERFDIALAPGPITQKPRDEEDPIQRIPSAFPEANTGVIVVRRSDKMIHFLERWKAEFRDDENGLFRKHGNGGEQVALRYMLWSSPDIRIYYLTCAGMPNLYNFRYKSNRSFEFVDRIKIHHCRDGLDGGMAQAPRHTQEVDARTPPTNQRGYGGTQPHLITTYRSALGFFDAFCKSKGNDFFFVQIGANDGKTCDPIWQKIRQYGWQGILIEPVGHLYKRLIEFHAGTPGLIFENIAIAAHDGSLPFHYFPEDLERDGEFPAWAKGMGSALGAFDSPGHRLVAERGFSMIATEVPCLTLDSLIRRHKVQAIDLLQIDAEGLDADILLSIDFSHCKPRFIQYEDRHIERLFKQGVCKWSAAEVSKHLVASGYKVFPVGNGFDRFCVRADP
jgi:FkbM family methyltransferase